MAQTVILARQGGNPTFSSLTVTGTTNFGDLSAKSLNVSGSISTSGSLTVSGSIIAQSLVVNTTIYSSGSNIFGNSLSNTQVFTGSMYVTGSTATFSGNVGIGISPSYALQVTGSTFLAGSTKFIVGGNNYNENIRCYAQSNDYSSIILGAVAGDSGTGAGQWSMVRWPSANSYKFTIRYNLTDSLTIDTSSNLTMVGNVTAYSDARVKTNIKTIDNALLKVLALRGVTYNRTDLEDKSEQIGVIAQEIKEILPQVVQETDGRYSVAYGNIVGVLIEAIKEQQLQIEELKSRL